VVCFDEIILISMLEKEFNYFLKHQEELVQKYNGRVLVIKGDSVIGVYDSEEIAYFETVKTHKPGTFLIQACTSGDASYTQTYNSRVNFA
jgi:hypothetical protein